MSSHVGAFTRNRPSKLFLLILILKDIYDYISFGCRISSDQKDYFKIIVVTINSINCRNVVAIIKYIRVISWSHAVLREQNDCFLFKKESTSCFITWHLFTLMSTDVIVISLSIGSRNRVPVWKILTDK